MLYSNGLYFTLYWLKSPFFDKYICIDGPWPWQSDDKKEWNELLWRTLKVVSLNMFFIVPLVEAPFYLFDLPIDLDFTMEGLPDSYKLIG